MTVLENTCTPYGMKLILEELKITGSLELSRYDEETREELIAILDDLDVDYKVEMSSLFVTFSSPEPEQRVTLMVEIFETLLEKEKYENSSLDPQIYIAIKHFFWNIKCPSDVEPNKIVLYC